MTEEERIEAAAKTVEAHKIMTREEYAKSKIIGWHSACFDIDRFDNVGVNFTGPQPAVAWQQIETAPKDGSSIILFAASCLESGRGVVIGNWYAHPSAGGWITDELDCGDYEFKPTHWMPLPAPPITASEGEVG